MAELEHLVPQQQQQQQQDSLSGGNSGGATRGSADTERATNNAMQLQQLLDQMRHLPELPGVLRPAQPPAWTQQLLLQARPLNMAAFRRVLSDIFVTHDEVRAVTAVVQGSVAETWSVL
ncbi:hypothetical protein OEZ86_013556 [Tetradesmus obliquus]|nr:hypothetical protein OEZ86_013556 [Tetradesmus obliquus]